MKYLYVRSSEILCDSIESSITIAGVEIEVYCIKDRFFSVNIFFVTVFVECACNIE